MPHPEESSVSDPKNHSPQKSVWFLMTQKQVCENNQHQVYITPRGTSQPSVCRPQISWEKKIKTTQKQWNKYMKLLWKKKFLPAKQYLQFPKHLHANNLRTVQLRVILRSVSSFFCVSDEKIETHTSWWPVQTGAAEVGFKHMESEPQYWSRELSSRCPQGKILYL